jgi:hypothetical protein
LKSEFRQIHTNNDNEIDVNESDNELREYILNHPKDLELLSLVILEAAEVFSLCLAIATFDNEKIATTLEALKKLNKKELVEIITEHLRGN